MKEYRRTDNVFDLEGTQYEGRADRLETVSQGAELTCKLGKDKNGEPALEAFYNGQTVGYIPKWNVAPLIALLQLDRITLKFTVEKCIPKSMRGARAKNAEVTVRISFEEKAPLTPEEREKLREEKRRQLEEKKRTERSRS